MRFFVDVPGNYKAVNQVATIRLSISSPLLFLQSGSVPVNDLNSFIQNGFCTCLQECWREDVHRVLSVYPFSRPCTFNCCLNRRREVSLTLSYRLFTCYVATSCHGRTPDLLILPLQCFPFCLSPPGWTSRLEALPTEILP